MSEEVRRNDRVGLCQLLEDGSPGVRAVADAVDQQEGRPFAGADVGPSVPVDGAVLHRKAIFPAATRAEPDLGGVDCFLCCRPRHAKCPIDLR